MIEKRSQNSEHGDGLAAIGVDQIEDVTLSFNLHHSHIALPPAPPQRRRIIPPSELQHIIPGHVYQNPAAPHHPQTPIRTRVHQRVIQTRAIRVGVPPQFLHLRFLIRIHYR